MVAHRDLSMCDMSKLRVSRGGLVGGKCRSPVIRRALRELCERESGSEREVPPAVPLLYRVLYTEGEVSPSAASVDAVR